MKQELNERERRIFVDLSPARAVLALAVPTVLSQIIFVIYNLADTYFVGRANNPNMVAAVTLVGPLYLMLTGLSNLFGIGGSSMIARSLGAGNFKKARNVSSFAFWGAVIVTAIYSIILLIFRDHIAWLLGGKPETLDYAKQYMIWVCVIGGLPTVLGNMLSHLVRAEGAAKQSSLGISMGGVLNIILDPLFMFVILPDGYQVMGAAMATALSNLFVCFYFAWVIAKDRHESVITFRPSEFSMSNGIPGDVITIGLPSCLMSLLASFSNAIANNLMAGMSASALAGFGIAKKVNLLAFRVNQGVTQGSLPLIAYSHSAKNYDRMKKSIISTAVLGVGFAVFWMSMSLLFGKYEISFFISNEETVYYGMRFLRIICLAVPLAATTMTGMMIFQAAAEKGKATLLSVLRKGILDIPLMFIFNKIWSVYGVSMATPCAEVISAVTTVVLVLRFLRRTKSPGFGSEEK